MADLSPAAQAVVWAWATARRTQTRTAGRHAALGAALRALADHRQGGFTLGQPGDHWSPDDRTRRELRNLAAELEGADGQ